jgi:phosphohistidine phosphatase
MKYLIIIRHAKSSWKDPSLVDEDRPLNKRGKRDAPMMGKIIGKKIPRPDLFLSSPAKRAITTAKIIAEKIDFAKTVKKKTHIYAADVDDLLKLIHKIDNKYQRVFICGHNPGCLDLANYLGREQIGRLPTCALVSLELEIDNWQQIKQGTGKLLLYDYPKKHY